MPASASQLVVAIKMMPPFHFHKMQSSKNRRGSKSKFKLLFTRSQYFHKIILLQERVDLHRSQGAECGSGDCGMDATGQGSQICGTIPTRLSEVTIHPLISQVSMETPKHSFQVVGMQKFKVTGNDSFHYSAPSRSGNLCSLSLDRTQRSPFYRQLPKPQRG